jgi:hypothetical protein
MFVIFDLISSWHTIPYRYRYQHTFMTTLLILGLDLRDHGNFPGFNELLVYCTRCTVSCLLLGLDLLVHSALMIVILQRFLVVITCLVCCSSSFNFSVQTNGEFWDVLEGDRVLLSFDLHQSFTLRVKQFCLLINGVSCYCQDSLSLNTEVLFPLSCASKLQSLQLQGRFWVSSLVAVQQDFGLPDRVLSSDAIFVTNLSLKSQVSLVLPLMLDDLSRAAVLFNSLKLIPQGVVHELICFVPEDHLKIMQGAIAGFSNDLLFFTRVLSEKSLFADFNLFGKGQQRLPYAIQMAIKLLAAKEVVTEFYLTLDADLLLLRPKLLSSVVNVDEGDYMKFTQDTSCASSVAGSECLKRYYSRHSKGLYHFEQRSVHASWWEGSELLLNLNPATSAVYQRWSQNRNFGSNSGGGSESSKDEDSYFYQVSDSGDESHSGMNMQHGRQQEEQGFGVTPAVLSTFGSLLTSNFLCQQLQTSLSNPFIVTNDFLVDSADGTDRYTQQAAADAAECEEKWVTSLGQTYVLQHDYEHKQDEVANKRTGTLLWSEYTLYRIVLDHFEVLNLSSSSFLFFYISHIDSLVVLDMNIQIFNRLHFRERSAVGAVGNNTTVLHCNNVWYQDQLPWQAAEAAAAHNCLFSVVQSSTGVSPSVVLKQYNKYFTS